MSSSTPGGAIGEASGPMQAPLSGAPPVVQFGINKIISKVKITPFLKWTDWEEHIYNSNFTWVKFILKDPGLDPVIDSLVYFILIQASRIETRGV